ncbi:hypothetical protein [Acinetobacter pittii]|uniref:hypothetical protein n=1 Tax=Acinetobacter pittii TaxID=48296 RepID=UPI002DC034B3|nr:hypothetical protein [Acinetobacter pittii]MEB7640832.1 hypothetical protein [Acinetobacter pittii]
MMNYQIYLVFLSSFLLVGCEGEANYTSGVSIGGTGSSSSTSFSTSNIGTTTPLPSQDVDTTDYGDQYVIWSKGRNSITCNNIRIDIELLHNQTEQPLEKGQGTFITTTSEQTPSNVFIQITTANLNPFPIYENHKNCQPDIKLLDNEGIILQNIQASFCKENPLTIKYLPHEEKKYKYQLAIALTPLQQMISYASDFSFEKNELEKQKISCPSLTYDVEIEKY